MIAAIDGPSGAGKSTLAALIRRELTPATVTVIEGDDFYRGGSDATWDARSAAANVDEVIDWRRQRLVLDQLLTHGEAFWIPFGWGASGWASDDPPFATTLVRARRAPLIVLEGVYSCRPELHDLIDRRILLDAPAEIRTERLRQRDGAHHDSDWMRRWARPEQHYFTSVMPPRRFDLVVGC